MNMLGLGLPLDRVELIPVEAFEDFQRELAVRGPRVNL